jgi:hypothetical protein
VEPGGSTMWARDVREASRGGLDDKAPSNRAPWYYREV